MAPMERHTMATENTTPAGIAWEVTVVAEHAQSDRVREDSGSDDFWRPLAHKFVPPKKGEAPPDDTLIKLIDLVSSSDTVLDVGSGGGRLAIPLAESCSHVTAVEPSEAMREQLMTTAEAWGVGNISVVPDRWEQAEVEPHDLVISAHVVYTVTKIESFIRKMTAHARKTAAIITFERPATASYLPLWSYIHDEERIELPSLQQIEQLLTQMGIKFKFTPLLGWEPRPFKTREQAQKECQTRLFVAPGTEKDQKLSELLSDSLIQVEGGFRLEWAKTHRPAIVSWNV
jgi:2-polyprenyl-3-methyl-5-hydroxy-6-metoxy-1,4-benzoquinol methylase